MDLEMSIKKWIKDLSHSEVYNRKHALWMLARMAQKGKAGFIVSQGAIPLIVKCLDDEMIVKYRAVWTLSMLAKSGQKQAVLDADIIPIFQSFVNDEAKVEICHPHTSEIIYTTLGELAKEGMANLQ